MGDAYLDPNFCPYVRAIMGETLMGTYPFLSGLVIMNTCDGMRRLTDALLHSEIIPFVHIMDLPRLTTPAAIDYYGQEIERLRERICTEFDLTVTDDAISGRLEESNETEALIRRIEELRNSGELDLGGHELIGLLKAAGVLPRKTFHSFLQRVIAGARPIRRPQGIPILVTGSMLENPDFIAVVEGYGARVVVHDLCLGSRRSGDPLSSVDDPLSVLAHHYLLKPPCARMQDNDRRLDYLLGLIESYRVEGVIYYVLKFCDTFLYEVPVMKRVLDKMGVPMLVIESEYRKGIGGGTRTRVQAFLEMLQTGRSLGRTEVRP
jgi:benzoyl-CoA reductase/2-hydroxyglutaryl-CoA dehydratase subunit BcrC/BadD/HgdB